jgi:hypothetical protein
MSPSVGDLIVVSTYNGRIAGVVKFATPTFISVDQGGVTAILKHDPNSNSWRFGKNQVTWQLEKTATVSILEKLKAVRQMAIEKGY